MLNLKVVRVEERKLMVQPISKRKEQLIVVQRRDLAFKSFSEYQTTIEALVMVFHSLR
jgi:hypothetical protein